MIKRIMNSNPFLKSIYDLIVNYPAPMNLSYVWNFGISAGIFLMIQFITGILLAMYYVPNTDLAFNSVRYILDNVDYGISLRTYHASGSSLFFFVTYMHLFRGLYYASYTSPRYKLWLSGVIILLLMIITAFIGYVLPWGQMSFWAATVITNLISIVPYIGEDVLFWLWGGYSIDDATLHRFFSLHYLLPFILLAFVIIHIILLHQVGSNNPLGVGTESEKTTFFPYFVIKDLFSSLLLLWGFNHYSYKHKPEILDYDNYIESNPLITPAHIVPEWYFKPFYAILRSVPNKEGGFLLLILSIVVLMIFPLLVRPLLNSARFRPYYAFFFALFIVDFCVLTFIGGAPIEHPYYIIGQIATAYYFMYFIIIIPGVAIWENFLYTRKQKAIEKEKERIELEKKKAQRLAWAEQWVAENRKDTMATVFNKIYIEECEKWAADCKERMEKEAKVEAKAEAKKNSNVEIFKTVIRDNCLFNMEDSFEYWDNLGKENDDPELDQFGNPIVGSEKKDV